MDLAGLQSLGVMNTVTKEQPGTSLLYASGRCEREEPCPKTTQRNVNCGERCAKDRGSGARTPKIV